jgi:CheY-like chemotaxis protein
MDDLIDVRRIGLGKLVLLRKAVDLLTVVRQAVESCGISASDRQLVLRFPDAPLVVHADPVRLGPAFSNLLNNAFKFTDPGGRIEVTATVGKGEASVSVKDDGEGIPPEKLKTVFEMFAQLESSREHARGGIGIGLTLVKRLIDLHGGTIEARSDGLGHGSEFVVRLPVLEAAKPEAASAEPASNRLSGVRVLVVDDNRDAATSLAMFLERTDNDVRMAFDGEEAVGIAASFRPEIILLDLGLPRMDGYEATRRIRKQAGGKDILIVAMTGRGQEADRERSAEATLDGHLVKPVDPRQFGKLIGRLRTGRARPKKSVD